MVGGRARIGLEEFLELSSFRLVEIQSSNGKSSIALLALLNSMSSTVYMFQVASRYDFITALLAIIGGTSARFF